MHDDQKSYDGPMLARAESPQPPAQQAFRQMFEAIEENETLIARLTDRLNPVLNPATMGMAKESVPMKGDDRAVSEHVSTIRVQALRIELLNERLRQVLEAVEV